MIKHYIKLVIGIIWRFGWNFRCEYCGKFKPLRKVSGNHDHCEAEYDRFIEEMETQRAAEEDAFYHMDSVLDKFCDHYGCWGEIGWCQTHDVCSDCKQFIHDCRGLCQLDAPEDNYDCDDDDDEDPLAGDIDDGSHYVPEPSPLNTQHYFALKERGYI